VPAIPISQLVKVNPAVLAAAGSAVDLNGLMLTQSPYAPFGQFLQFASPADVGVYFGMASIEYACAQVYFAGYTNCTKTPGVLYFTLYAETAISGWMRSGKQTSLAALQALTGSLTVTIDGVVKTAAALSFTGLGSFSAIATAIQTGLGAGVVTYDSIQQAFIITSGTTGAASSVSYATGTLATALTMTSATGAVTSAGQAAATPGAAMAANVAINQNWACFMTTWESLLAEKQLFAAWSSSMQPRYLYVGQDTDVNSKTAGSTTTFGAYLQANSMIGSMPVFGDYTHASFVLGFAASLDFSRLNGRATIAYKSQSGLLPSVTNGTDAAALEANGYNYYGAFANAKSNWLFMFPGSVSGQWLWLDSYLNQMWLNANLQLAMVNLLLSVGSAPYNADGYGLVNAACLDPVLTAVNFGAIRKGVKLSASQISQMRFALGFDASPAVIVNGFYLQIVDATAAIRVTRASPSMALYYADGGSIQRLTLASIEIQ
jgi:hypothetical protein